MSHPPSRRPRRTRRRHFSPPPLDAAAFGDRGEARILPCPAPPVSAWSLSDRSARDCFVDAQGGGVVDALLNEPADEELRG
eukprot:2722271-Pyramimonas_sp.AAC.1